jgi:hypothetical protein
MTAKIVESIWSSAGLRDCAKNSPPISTETFDAGTEHHVQGRRESAMMKELNLTVFTSGGEAKVTMLATFETHDQAVAFHDGVARLCREHSLPKGQEREWWGRPKKLLGPPSS